MSLDPELIVANCAEIIFENAGIAYDDFVAKLLKKLNRKKLSDSLVNSIQSTLSSLIDSGEFVARETDGEETTFYACDAFYENSVIRVKPTEEELSGGYMLLGHRFVPYYIMNSFNQLPLIMYKGKKLAVKRVELSSMDADKYFSLLDIEHKTFAMAYSTDRLANCVTDDRSLTFVTYDMSEVYPLMSGLTVGFRLCRNDNGEFFFDVQEDRGPAVDFSAIHRYVKGLDEGISELNRYCPGMSVQKQLQAVVPDLPLDLVRNPPIAFSQYVEMSKCLGFEYNGVCLSLYDKGEMFPDEVVEKSLEEAKSTLLRLFNEADDLFGDGDNMDLPDDNFNEADLLKSIFGDVADSDFEDDNVPVRKTAPVSDAVYTFKVAVDHNKRVYREIAVHSQNSWQDFHRAIIRAFGFHDDHLYSFFFTGKSTKSHRTRWNAPEIPCLNDGVEGNNSSSILVGEVNLKPKEKFYYLFDYGDEWWFEVTLQNEWKGEMCDYYPKTTLVRGKSPQQYSDWNGEGW